MKYRLLVKTISVSESNHTSTVQDVVEFDNYVEANEAFDAINTSEKQYLELYSSGKSSVVSRTTAIRLYKVN